MKTNVSFMLSSECDFVRRSKTSIAVKAFDYEELCIGFEDSSREDFFMYFPKGKYVVIESERVDTDKVKLSFFEADKPDEKVTDKTHNCAIVFVESTLNNPVVLSITPQSTYMDVNVEVLD